MPKVQLYSKWQLSENLKKSSIIWLMKRLLCCRILQWLYFQQMDLITKRICQVHIILKILPQLWQSENTLVYRLSWQMKQFRSIILTIIVRRLLRKVQTAFCSMPIMLIHHQCRLRFRILSTLKLIKIKL